MKNRLLGYLTSAALVISSFTAVSAFADVPDKFETGENSAVCFDFTSESNCAEYISAASASGSGTLSVRPSNTGGFGVYADFGKGDDSGEPTVTFGTNIDVGKYKFAKIVYGYQTVRNTLSDDENPLTAYIRLGEGVKNKIAEIAHDGSGLTAADGNSYDKKQFTVSAREKAFVSTVLELDSTGISGEVPVTYCPGSSPVNASVRVSAVIKYIAFFETKEAAVNFDISVKGAVSDFGKGEEFDAVANPLERKVYMDLPNLYIRAEELTEDNVKLTVPDSHAHIVSQTVNTDNLTIDYVIKSFDSNEYTWQLVVNCKQADDENKALMVRSLNEITAENAAGVISEWSWLMSDISPEYAALPFDAADAFALAMIANAGNVSADTIVDMLKNESFLAEIKTADADKLADVVDKFGYSSHSLWNMYQTMLSDDERSAASVRILASANYDAFRQNIILGIYGVCINGEYVRYMVENNLSAFGYTAETYKALTDKTDDLERVYKRITGLEVESVSDIAKQLESAVAFVGKQQTEEKPENVSNRGGSSSRGSGSGGGSISVAIPGGESTDGTQPSKPSAPTSNADVFTDISDTSWARESILSLYKKGVVNGKSSDKFAPFDNVKREEFVKMIVIAMNINTGGTDSGLSDVNQSEWYAPYIAAAVNAKIVGGKPDGTFGIGENISREDMAVIAYRAAVYSLGAMPGGDFDFADKDSISDYAYTAVSALYANGIVTGTNGRFSPHDGATRAETAVIADRLINFAECAAAGRSN